MMDRNVGRESAKAFGARWQEGFWTRYLSGAVVLDIGYRGGDGAVPILPHAVGIEVGDPNYDGLRLPYADMTVDAVHASHVLEHVPDQVASLREWFRVLKIGGTLVLFVPSAYLYERRLTVPPSLWSGEHLRAYTPSTLLRDVETALAPNIYRVEHLADRDDGYDYDLPPTVHPTGCLEIELVIRRRVPPAWTVEP